MEVKDEEKECLAKGRGPFVDKCVAQKRDQTLHMWRGMVASVTKCSAAATWNVGSVSCPMSKNQLIFECR